MTFSTTLRAETAPAFLATVAPAAKGSCGVEPYKCQAPPVEVTTVLRRRTGGVTIDPEGPERMDEYCMSAGCADLVEVGVRRLAVLLWAYLFSIFVWTAIVADVRPVGYKVNFSCHPAWAGASLVVEGKRAIPLTCEMIEFSVPYDRTVLLVAKEGCDVLYYDILQEVEASGEAYVGLDREQYQQVCTWPATERLQRVPVNR